MPTYYTCSVVECRGEVVCRGKKKNVFKNFRGFAGFVGSYGINGIISYLRTSCAQSLDRGLHRTDIMPSHSTQPYTNRDTC